MKTPLKLQFLFLGIFFLVAGGLYWLFNDKAKADRFDLQVQQQVKKAIGRAHEDHAALQHTLEEASSFQHYQRVTHYPYFLYKGDSLIYWSSHRYIPEKRLGMPPETFIDYNQNLGMLVRTDVAAGTSRYTLLSLVELFHAGGRGLNPAIFQNFSGELSTVAKEGSVGVKGSNGENLFFFTPTGKVDTWTITASTVTRWILAASLLFLGLAGAIHVSMLEKKHRLLPASVHLILVVGMVRGGMWYLGLPWKLLPPSLVPDYLLAPPGLGDQILNALSIVLVLGYMVLWQLETLTNAGIRKYSKPWKSAIPVALVLASLALGYGIYGKVESIYDHPAVDLGDALKLAQYNVGPYLYLFALFGVYFLGNHLLINAFCKIQPGGRAGFLHWLYGTLLGGMLFFYNGFSLWGWLISGLYFLIALALKLPRYFYILRFKTFVYYLTAVFAFTFILFSLTLRLEQQKILQHQETFAKKLLLQKDLKAEMLLDQFRKHIRNDTVLANALQQPVFASETLRYLIKDSLLSPYFFAYDVDVHAFTTGGRSLEGDSLPPLSQVYSRYAAVNNRTEYPGLFFIRQPQTKNKYVLFSEVLKKGIVRGVIMITVSYNTSDLASTTEKLSNHTLRTDPTMWHFSYAMYDKNGKVIYREGNFDYHRSLALFSSKDTTRRQFHSPGFQHYVQHDPNGNMAVVSHVADFYRDILSSFSFLFLINLTGTVGLLALMYVLSGFKFYRVSFSSKIQFFLNMAFLVPLTIIILLTLGVVISSFIHLQNRSLRENSTNVANTITLHYQDYISGNKSQAYVEEQLGTLALSGDFEITIFDRNGHLVYTSAPTLYRSRQLSDRIDPVAYARLLSGNQDELLLQEKKDSRVIKTMYLNGKGPDRNLFGIIAITFPEAGYVLQDQIKEVGAAILIIFLIMFIVLLAFSYAASNNLTSPLKLIAQTLKKTNLNAKNEAISWHSNDEIGMLTSEYNRMIKKLEESRVALSASEKQAAWREMARQVAHEIKNPLTPMKLSIQQLQRTLPADNEETREKINRALASLNEQIDNISEITNSFSEFAKMPVPTSEAFDLVATVSKALDLYSQNNNIKINFLPEKSEIMVRGDKMILSRAVNNLVLNGLQSVPPTRKPIIHVTVSEKEDMGLVEVRDNGAGIPVDVRKKVFIPNFSTKQGGSGLGLSMAKRGIEHSGGNLWFDSHEEEGTTFYLELPKIK